MGVRSGSVPIPQRRRRLCRQLRQLLLLRLKGRRLLLRSLPLPTGQRRTTPAKRISPSLRGRCPLRLWKGREGKPRDKRAIVENKDAPVASGVGSTETISDVVAISSTRVEFHMPDNRDACKLMAQQQCTFHSLNRVLSQYIGSAE